ncbi:MAG: F0F1 ATP synthase subunit A [Pyrinomonadaceae bacterium]
MFWFLQEHAVEAAGETAGHTETAAHHTPAIVELVNQYLGPWANKFELAYTKPAWDWLLGKFGTSAEALFGPYTVENAIPWYTVMFFLACLITMGIIWILKGKLSESEPGHGQQTLEVSVLALRGLLEDVVGPHGLKYFPVVGTFAILILVSNLMGLIPFLLPPTTSTSVTFALGISSFVYYNYIGIKENGLFGHLGHFAGVNYFSGAILLIMGPAMFIIELISNAVRPMSLGLRLFGNLFGDEQVGSNIAALYPPYTYFIVPALLMVLSVFAAFMQTFIFTLLSMIYIGEVSHAPHGDHSSEHGHVDGDEIIAPVLT